MTTRRKPKTPAVVINSLDEADAVLRQMAECDREIEHIRSTMNDAIDAVKAEAKDMSAPYVEQHKDLEESLAAYATYQKHKLFTQGRTVRGVFGRFGFRVSSELKPQPKNTWGGVLDQLKGLGMTQAVRVKEEVNKEVLQEWPDERLEKVGARRVKSDRFWVEVDQAALEDRAHAAR